jgi:uncharacterized NAD(P)/FAD-binding protein YdhS
LDSPKPGIWRKTLWDWVYSAPPAVKPSSKGKVIEDLVVIGSLRKAGEWESTAVPELRVQAALAADASTTESIGPNDTATCAAINESRTS